jgi:hypothetical protein
LLKEHVVDQASFDEWHRQGQERKKRGDGKQGQPDAPESGVVGQTAEDSAHELLGWWIDENRHGWRRSGHDAHCAPPTRHGPGKPGHATRTLGRHDDAGDLIGRRGCAPGPSGRRPVQVNVRKSTGRPLSELTERAVFHHGRSHIEFLQRRITSFPSENCW